MLKYIYRKFQWVVDLLVDGYLEFKRKVSRSMLKESIIPLPEYFKKNYLEKCIRYELSDNQRGLGWKSFQDSTHSFIMMASWWLAVYIQFPFTWLIFLFGRFLGPFIYGFFYERDWEPSLYGIWLHCWHIYKAYTSTWKIDDEGTIMWSSEFLWQSLYTKIRNDRVLHGKEWQVLEQMDSERFSLYLSAWSQRLHTTSLPKPSKASVVKWRGNEKVWDFLNINNGEHSKQLDRSYIYSGDNNDYELQAMLIGQLMGKGDYYRRLLTGGVFNEYHSPNSRPNPMDAWMMRLNLRQLPRNMEIPEHYPEALYKRMPHIEADQIRWATTDEGVVIKKLSAIPTFTKTRWQYKFSGFDMYNRPKIHTIDYTFIKDILLLPNTLYSEVKAAMVTPYQYVLYEYIMLPDIAHKVGDAWLGLVSGNTFLISVNFAASLAVLLTLEGILNNWCSFFPVAVIIGLPIFIYYSALFAKFIIELSYNKTLQAWDDVYSTFSEPWRRRSRFPKYLDSVEYHKNHYETYGFWAFIKNLISHEYLFFCHKILRTWQWYFLFFPRIIFDMLYSIAEATVQFGIDVYNTKDPEEFDLEQAVYEKLNEGVEKVIYSYYRDGGTKSVRLNPFFKRTADNEEEIEFFNSFRPFNITEEGEWVYLTEADIYEESGVYMPGFSKPEVKEAGWALLILSARPDSGLVDSTLGLDFNLHRLATQLSDPSYSEYFKFEILLFIVLLFLLIKSLSWRLQHSYRSLNFWLNIFVILLLFVVFMGTFFSKELFIGSKLLFNCGILVNYFISYAKLFIMVVAIFFLLVSLKFFFSAKNKYNDFVDYPLLIGLAVFFLLILVSSFDLMIMYVAIEGLSILLYILAIFPFKQSSIEASIKYYSLGALSSGILLFGISLMYGVTGAFDFFNIKTYFLFNFSGDHLIFYLMLLSFIFSFLFKLSAFPGHMWAPDVYEGTWLPTTVFFMTVVKVSLYFFFIRFLIYFFYFISTLYQDILIISALGSLIVGCFGSLYQHGIKRLFAYGSISQVGFSLIGLVCNSVGGIISSLIFFTIYIIVSLGVFTILINTEAFYSGKNMSSLSDLSNFSKYNMLVSVFLSTFLLSMAGIPPLAGFFGKLFIFISTIGANYYGLTLGVILLSTINVFVYIRMIKILWSDTVLLVTEENNLEDHNILLYDIFVMSLPKTWRASKVKSMIFSFYENMVFIILTLITSFVLFFFLILNDYFIFCNELAISLVDALFKDNF